MSCVLFTHGHLLLSNHGPQLVYFPWPIKKNSLGSIRWALLYCSRPESSPTAVYKGTCPFPSNPVFFFYKKPLICMAVGLCEWEAENWCHERKCWCPGDISVQGKNRQTESHEGSLVQHSTSLWSVIDGLQWILERVEKIRILYFDHISANPILAGL